MVDEKTEHRLARRDALRVLGSGVFFGGVVARSALARAETKKEGDAKAVDCSKEGKIDKKSKQMRKVLQYVDKTKQPGKVCSGCIQWVAAEKGKSCGGCKLFTGPVNPNGYCLSYAPSKA